MIPEFNNYGNLPKGIHLVTISEFKKRFVNSIKREELFIGIERLMKDLRKFNCKAIYIDGSYVTDNPSPKDIDVLWEDDNIEYPFAELMLPILFESNIDIKRAYGFYVYPANYNVTGIGLTFLNFFQLDKASGTPKGIIKIKIN